MIVKELRSRLAAFDDATDVVVAPRMKVERVEGGEMIDLPHPRKHYEITSVHVVTDIDPKTKTPTRSYIALAFPDPEAPETGGKTVTVGRNESEAEIAVMNPETREKYSIRDLTTAALTAIVTALSSSLGALDWMP